RYASVSAAIARSMSQCGAHEYGCTGATLSSPRGRSSMAEHLASTQGTRVRFSPPASFSPKRSRSSAVSRGRPGWNRSCVPESADQRHNRELIELLNELRVALPGVQVLFAFLLAVPFANGFPKLGKLDRHVFFAAFVAAALSTVLLIAPSSYHRLRWRQHHKERMLV